MCKKYFLRTFILFGYISSVLTFQVALGQEDTGSGPVLEEVIVTAEKRAESIDKLAFAVSAYQPETLDKWGVLDAMGLQTLEPSLVIGKAGANAYTSIRGIGTELGNIGAETGVTWSSDGVTQLRSIGAAGLFVDVERVEVLRGPQGTISGRNATGGAINVISNRPTDEVSGRAKISLGNYDRIATEGYLNGPIANGKVLARVAFLSDRATGWLDNQFRGEDVESTDITFVRGSFLMDMSDSVEALLIMSALNDKSTAGYSTVEIGRARPDTQTIAEAVGTIPADLDALTINADQETVGNKEQYGATLIVNWDISPSSSMTSTTGYSSVKVHATTDCDATELSVCSFPSTPEFPHGIDWDVEQFSQEVAFTANLTDRLDFLIGGLYLQEEALEPVQYVAELGGLPPGSILFTASGDLTSYAAYSQLRYSLSDKLRLAVGARYTKDSKDYGQDNLIFGGASSVRDSSSWSGATPRIALDYAVSDDVTLYSNVAWGFKGGGFNTFGPVVDGRADQFDPEDVTSYEAGLKGRFLDDSVRIAAAGFYMDYKDLQQVVTGLSGSFLPTVVNAGQAEIKGIELEVTALPTENLRLGFNAAWIDATFTELASADNIYPELGQEDPTQPGLLVRDLSGKKIPRVPETKLVMSAEYAKPLANGNTLGFGANYTWRSEVYWTIFNNEGVDQASYGLLNMQGYLESQDGAWRFSAFARNVLDERYFVQGGQTPKGVIPVPAATGKLGTPRTYGVSVSYLF
tara:strand:- start:1907 stop:4153 length:2247 start_codon:yes stop_codon:yes gene_type:complete